MVSFWISAPSYPADRFPFLPYIQSREPISMEQKIWDGCLSVACSRWMSFVCSPFLLILVLIHRITYESFATILYLAPLSYDRPAKVNESRVLELSIDSSAKSRGAKFLHLSAKKLAAMLRTGEVSSHELVEVQTLP